MGDLPARPHPQVRGLWRRWTSLLDVGVDMPSEDAGQRAPKLRRAVLEAAADPAAVRTHPLTLRFASPELELAFKEEYERESVRHIRFAVAMGLFLVATFGVLDAVIQPAVRHELWLIRYGVLCPTAALVDRKSTRLNSSHGYISYAVFCLKKKKKTIKHTVTHHIV